MTTDIDMLAIQRSLLGGRYVFGAKDPGPHGRSDCSGYSSGCMRDGGLPFADGSWDQQDFCAAHGLYWPGLEGIQKARMFPGLGIIFRRAGTVVGGRVDPVGHVILIDNPDLSDEYASTDLGSGHWRISGRPFTGGGFLPGVIPHFQNPIIQPPVPGDTSMKIIQCNGQNADPGADPMNGAAMLLYDSGIAMDLNGHDFVLCTQFYKIPNTVVDWQFFMTTRRMYFNGTPQNAQVGR